MKHMTVEKQSHESWWDRNAPPGWLRNRPRGNLFRQVAKILAEKGETLVDVGCGNGLAYRHMIAAGLDYEGVDFTEKFLQKAREKHPEIRVHHASAFNMPYEDGERDIAYCQDLLEHISPNDVDKAIHEMMRVADKFVLISFFRPPWNRPKNVVRRVGKQGYLTVRYSKDFITDIIKKHPRFKNLTTERFKRWLFYKIELESVR
jgi:ubiquinone/menaquinone biosynthesis C-methylase UbiE